MTYEFEFTSQQATQEFAEKLAQLLKPGDFLALEGDLGAGKTTFTQGLARGLGVKRVVNSPTFTIIKEYAGRLPLYHMDVYRVADQVDDLGLDEYFYGEGVCVVEWASLIPDHVPEDRMTIHLLQQGENVRLCRLEVVGKRSEQVGKEIDQHVRAGN
ncbi:MULTISPECIES: tRNA (adenosine(37)-N6)-threonylcarbamoyltransferase complex ATPase subunit type 1 TsaE [Brevibacillus]|uniref:tRNA (adenosine(37)-N6)-threonylcarbamoyltransferase complex ATPase subunit type 1 TsaE n=1 Tax=Brevibacillus TaxID=55080 RepID=UPI0002403380|nr:MULTISPECIES: tRNA (adenosine(37)-N6)-threonylcarbamoyltransferase complex ATPase subunit type 1 TsaE [Brevibacillus]AYK06467.1 tRNA (adenosine(37)-N6)-threonylcarbamoyltransferase complex ATPase subunit type 1 TsaE [Brevibacillus laterosporus]ERM16616.1 ATP-binding protein [Brevibacillus laterosporus PE36]MCR8965576.1 tRNA (adenosine(37)-N6)-threonylcarbamoyltransferase complex ATPase subunit type 1 TsaE [Brevibacillus laterosporus]MCR8997749.1 tRNA (adenosine(37)-N6)-threonylcarbamoyltrans